MIFVSILNPVKADIISWSINLDLIYIKACVKNDVIYIAKDIIYISKDISVMKKADMYGDFRFFM